MAKAAPATASTLLAITLTHAANVTLFKGKASFDFQKDLRPVALLAGSPMLVVVPAASPIKDFRDLIAAATSRQAQCRLQRQRHAAAPDAGAVQRPDEDARCQHVPYKGGAPSMTDLIGGQLDVIFSNLPESIAHVKSGKLRALAIASSAATRWCPTCRPPPRPACRSSRSRTGRRSWCRRPRPRPSVAKLGAEVLKIMAAPEIEERARTQGFRVDARGPQDFGAYLNSEIERWAKVIAAAKISAD